MDSGALYDPLVAAMRRAGLPTFRRVDRATARSPASSASRVGPGPASRPASRPCPSGPRAENGIAKPQTLRRDLYGAQNRGRRSGLLFVAGLAAAGDTKEATGTVKSVAADSITVTDSAAKDWTFAVDKETTVAPGRATRWTS